MSTFISLVLRSDGAGKSTPLKKLFDEFQEEFYFSISSTTHLPREGEQHGVDHYFIMHDEFQQDIDKEQFLEWVKVHENLYGTSLEHTQNALNDGKIVVFDIDIRGSKIVKKKMAEKIISAFITTENRDELKKRLIKRDIGTILQLEKRLQNASNEVKEPNEYDHFIINDKLEESYEALRTILITHKFKTRGQNLGQAQNIWNKEE